MTGKERVIRAIRHQETDRLPCYIELTSDEKEKMIQKTGNPNYTDYFANDIEMIGFGGDVYPKQGWPGMYVDDFGAYWDRSGPDKDIGILTGRVLKELGDLMSYKFPEIQEEKIRGKMKAFVDNGNDTFKVVGISFTMYERGWNLCGVEDMLAYFVEEPEFVHELFQRIYEYDLKLLKIILEYDIDAVCFGDDWGQQKGMIMGPGHWREYMKPQLKKLYQYVKDHGKFVIQHSCGDIREILDDLADIGLDVYQTFQPEIYPMEKVKEEIGSRLTFWGGISTQMLLPFASPEEVKDVVIKTVQIMRKGGGYILAPTHTVTGDVPPENVEMLAELFKNQNKYW